MTPVHPWLVLASILSMAFSAVAQVRWEEVPALEPRDGAAMATDPGTGGVVLFGGVGSTTLDDTWEWDGVTWMQRFPAHSPGPRRSHAVAWDAARS